jgi:hypothetical protein
MGPTAAWVIGTPPVRLPPLGSPETFGNVPFAAPRDSARQSESEPTDARSSQRGVAADGIERIGAPSEPLTLLDKEIP